MSTSTPDDPDSRPQDSRPQDSRSGDSILGAVARRTGRTPRVHLRDVGSADASPIIDPKATAYQQELRGADRGKYQVLGEIARGGMGVVLRGHDLELGRDVAMKVVHAELIDRPDVIERFVEEAQVGGQLQHPGIVPVYELGLMADDRPYFTMKLIKGRTLATILSRRASVDDDPVRYLSIFESVCQTMAYTHSKGVIHRDLKPANIMIGAFGEVQVVDWGLAKVLHRGGVADELAAQKEAQTIIATVRSGPQTGSDSLVGNVLGTPGYMAPEQAQGEVAQLDERTDVFALGAILCEILTGAPPYVAGEGENLLQMAAMAELEDARERIDASTAPDELKKLCHKCLMPPKQARPSSADEVAQSVHAHIAGLAAAAHEAQLAAAEERVRAERSRRRQQLTLVAAAVLLLVGGGWYWIDAERRDRRADLARGLDDVRAAALAHERNGNFEQALEVARGGRRLTESDDADASLRRRADELIAAAESSWQVEQARVAELERERVLLDFLTDIGMRSLASGITETDADLDAQYAAAFGAYGLDLDADNLDEKLSAIRDTNLGIRIALGFDGWARVARRLGGRASADAQLLTGIGLDVDTDDLRATVRLALVDRDAEMLADLADDPDLETAAAETVFLLGFSLIELGEEDLARQVATAGADRHPSDFLLNYSAGRALAAGGANMGAQGYFRAAIALRPDIARPYVELSNAQRNTGDHLGAARSAQVATALAPDNKWNAMLLGFDLFIVGRLEEGRMWIERELEENPRNEAAAAWLLAAKLMDDGDREDLVRWAASRGDRAGPGVWITPAMMFLNPGPGGEPARPERVLEMLEPFLPQGDATPAFWLALAQAYVDTGDGASALVAVARGREYGGPVDRHLNSQFSLLAAVAHRLEGNDDAADANLRHARFLRTQLVVGARKAWSDGSLEGFFVKYGDLAYGR